MSNWICGLEKLKLHFDVMHENDAWAKRLKYFTLWHSVDDFGPTPHKITRKRGQVRAEPPDVGPAARGVFNSGQGACSVHAQAASALHLGAHSRPE